MKNKQVNPQLTISRYRNSRNWAVWNGGDLLAVTVYRKGAQAIVDFINAQIIAKTNKTAL